MAVIRRISIRRLMAEVRPADRPWDDLAWQLWVEEPALMDRLVDDLRRHGQRKPVVIGPADDGHIELWDGHHRVTALRHLGRTVACWGPAEHPHHRRLKAQGVDHSLENLLAVCRACHRHIHDNVAESLAFGWLLGAHTQEGT